ncbi:MAG: hypothetical protein J7J68_01495 [Thermotogaceae bacterium]|nr:hypothetical protein [Thermotogaceae bacterium]
MRKIRIYFYSLILALLIIYFQKSWLIDVGNHSFSNVYSFNFSGIFFFSLIAGVTFGLLGCPGCSLGVFFGSCLPGSSRRDIILRNAIFHIVRLISIFVFTFGLSIAFGWAKRASYYFTLLGSGIIMIYLGIRLMLQNSKKCLNTRRKNNFIYAVWGILWGSMCGMEAVGFLMPLWFYDTSWPERVLSLIIFSLAAVGVPILVVIILVYLRYNILNVIDKEGENVFKFTAAFYLLIVGILFLRGVIPNG